MVLICPYLRDSYVPLMLPCWCHALPCWLARILQNNLISELSNYDQSTIVHKEEECDSWINYVVARSTSCGYRSVVSLPCYLDFQCRIRSGITVDLLRMRHLRKRDYVRFAEAIL